MILLLAPFAFAHEHEEEVAEGKRLVESKADCGSLTDEQLEAVGEYLMETMHPGESHEKMHEIMGLEEDSPAHKQHHIHMAQMMYCNKEMMKGGMMGPGMMKGGMMNARMMGQTMNGYNMMGTTWTVASILWLIALAGLVVLIWLWVFKLWRDLFRKH
jgi:hypothetical protein